MNKLKFFPLFFLLIGCFTTVKAQDEMPDAPPTANQQPKRPGLLGQLNLSREQIQQIRQINQENRGQMREANLRMREANFALDAAIYADTADETEIQTRVKEFNEARAEVIRLRTNIEFSVRKILTSEQLVKFREIRLQSLQQKEMLPRLRNPRQLKNPNRPLNNLRRQNRLPR